MSVSLVPGMSMTLAAFAFVGTWIDDIGLKNSVPSAVAKCGEGKLLSVLHQLNHTSKLQWAAKHLLCMRLAFLDAIHVDRAGVGALLIYGSVLIPYALRISYNAASPNCPSALQGPVLVPFVLALASIVTLVVGNGYGVFIAPAVALFYVIGARISSEDRARRRDVPELPAPTRAVYGANLATILCACLIASAAMHTVDAVQNVYWWEPYASASVRSIVKPAMGALSDLWPLVVATPLYFVGYSDVVRPRNKAAAESILQKYQAEEVAYGFERTWSYYRQAGLISAGTYVFGVSMVVRSIFQDKVMPSPSSIYLFYTSASIALAHVGITLADASTAPMPDALDQEGRDAIAKAPAGNPGLEDNVRALAILSLFAGPSLSLMLWHAQKEELRGWKGRRAWRTAVAGKSK